MGMKKVFLVLIMSVVLLPAFGQKGRVPVGSKAPEIVFDKSYPVGYEIPAGKPIILDF